MKRCSTKQSEAQDDCEARGSAFKGKDSGRQQNLPETIQHYALPIGRVGRFKSPHQKQQREALATAAGEGWPSSSGTFGKTQLRTPRQSYGNSADQPQYLQEENDNIYRYRNGRAESQTDRRPLERVRVQRHSARAERDGNYDFSIGGHEFQDQHPYEKPVKLQHPQAGRDDGNQVRSEGLSKQKFLISDNSRVGGRVARFKTLAGKSDEDMTTSLSRPPPDCLHTTVVQILNQDNNKIGEVAIHTHPLNGGGGSGRGVCMSRGADARIPTRVQSVKDEIGDNTTITRGERLPMPLEAREDHPRPSTAPGRSKDLCRPSLRPTTAALRFQPTSTVGRHNKAPNLRATQNFIASLRRKQCIGSDYAELLRAEIVRLREDRLSLEGKSLNTAFDPQRELPSTGRPGWRNVY
ncbi:hypothetical protein Mapa_004503 [Marchantia paleacea]|nr:hypothetical protein Mapa_004503 [Marchantia paleacea]